VVTQRVRTITQPSPRLFPLSQDQVTSDDYYTPPWLFERMAITFDIDVCAPPGGLPWIPAARSYTQVDDGLAQPWEGRVWMNPPFSNTAQWVDRFLAHRDGVMLCQVSKSAYTTATWAAVDAVVMVPGKIAFVVSHDLTGGDDRYRQIYMPCWLVAFGDDCVDAIGRVGPVRRKV
jgi:hypothetical protein